MKNKIIGIFCMAPLVALIVIVVCGIVLLIYASIPTAISMFKEVGLRPCLLGLGLALGFFGLMGLFKLGRKKFRGGKK